MPIGGTGEYQNCGTTYGNAPQCATGICSLDGEDSNHRDCLSSDNDCPGHSCHAVGMPSAIEGASVGGLSACYP